PVLREAMSSDCQNLEVSWVFPFPFLGRVARTFCSILASRHCGWPVLRGASFPPRPPTAGCRDPGLLRSEGRVNSKFVVIWRSNCSQEFLSCGVLQPLRGWDNVVQASISPALRVTKPVPRRTGHPLDRGISSLRRKVGPPANCASLSAVSCVLNLF